MLEKLVELYSTFGEISTRSMFGGFGVFHNNTMFALVIKQAVFYRIDPQATPALAALNMEPYVYHKKGFPVHSKYFRLPEHISIFSQQPEQIQWLINHGRMAIDYSKQHKRTLQKNRNLG